MSTLILIEWNVSFGSNILPQVFEDRRGLRENIGGRNRAIDGSREALVYILYWEDD